MEHWGVQIGLEGRCWLNDLVDGESEVPGPTPADYNHKHVLIMPLISQYRIKSNTFES